MVKKFLATERTTLTRRVIFWILLTSTSLAIIASGIQLYINFQRDRQATLSTFDTIQSSFEAGLENALWEFNSQQVSTLLDGIEVITDVVHIELVSTTGQTWLRGVDRLDNLVVKELPLQFKRTTGQMEPVGQLTIGLSLAEALNRLKSQLITLLLTNFLKTTLVALAMILILQRLVFRHLRAITDYVNRSDWISDTGMLALDRETHEHNDELSAVSQAINNARARYKSAYAKLDNEVAEHKVAQQSLELANNELRQANQEQSDFAYSLSHDLKSPTTTTKGLLQALVEDHGTSLNTESHWLIDRCQSTLTRMQVQIDAVLAYSRSVNQSVEFISVDLTECIGAVISDSETQIKKYDADIQVNTPHRVFGDEALLLILFSNLLSNAIKFTDIDVKPEIKFHSDQLSVNNRELVQVTIADNGIGIETQYFDKIFKLFNRLHVNEVYSGSGIGLATCKRIIAKHGGSIQVDSKPGAGTQFKVYLPADTERDDKS